MHILMIEDNEDDYILFSEYLSTASTERFETSCRGTLAQGLAFLESHAVDALLLDMGLPDSQGLATFDRVQARFPTLPVVIISGHDNDEQALEAVRRGAQDYLVKGQVGGPLLARAIQYALERKQTDAALKRYARRMEILHEIDSGIIGAHSIQTIVETTLKHTRELIHCQRAALILFDMATNEWFIFADDANRPYSLGREVRTSIPPGWDDGFGTENTRIINDLRLAQPQMPAYQSLIADGLVSGIQTLLITQGERIGLLGLNADTPGFFTAEHNEIAVEITNQLAIAIHQWRLSEALAHYTATLEVKVAERTANLIAVKEQVESILDNSSDGIVLVRDDLSIQQANFSFNRLFHAEAGDYLGQPLTRFFQVEDTSVVKKLIQTVIAEQTGQQIEVHTIDMDGKVFDTELSVGFIKGDSLVCTIRDITERIKTEQIIREQRDFLDQVIKNAPGPITVNDASGRVQLANEVAAQLLGTTAADMIGKTNHDLNLSQVDIELILRTGMCQGS